MTLYSIIFYVLAAIILVTTGIAITRRNLVHAVVYLVFSFFGSAMMFYLFGAPLLAVLEVIIYAGAIMVLFVFVIMMLNLGEAGDARERQWLEPRIWVFPALLAGILLWEMFLAIGQLQGTTSGTEVGPKAVGLTLFGPYVLAVEIASMLLLAGMVGAYHLGRRFLERNRGRHS